MEWSEIVKQKLVDFKNELLEDSDRYYDSASCNFDKTDAIKEMAISNKLKDIGDKLEKIIKG